MAQTGTRREFLSAAAAGALAPAACASYEERALSAQGAAGAPARDAPASAIPTGKIGPLTVTRLICGGNLISGFAHSRDLIYVSPLLKQYFTDEKVLDTLELCEAQGINTAIIRVDDHTVRIIDKYRRERGGAIQWIAQVKLTEKDVAGDITRAVDHGAVGTYVHGGVGDELAKKGNLAPIAEALALMRRKNVVAGLGGHEIETIMAYEKAGLAPDFYMKTLHATTYWSAGIAERNDSVWCERPEQTIAYMQAIARPWIAFKVLAAGAIHPKDGFAYAFTHGADFMCVGMFDFQVVEDVILARNALAGVAQRARPWRA